ncbi:rhamnogalacturonan lyase family protein [Gracilibacillus caseinilyticus]|uniref:rhamnogalacturonan lyase family protein n=1 Tax=Gracilibacillus caseinilyticus TaxID=2932256 RepID=UPI002738A42C|nr:fibronectin type III domain-containing protein [Gracilibacillus caseinilyticus]
MKAFRKCKKATLIVLCMMIVFPASSFGNRTSTIHAAEETDTEVMQFDFGKEDNGASDGYIGISDQTKYSEDAGYGFLDTANVSSFTTDAEDTVQSTGVTYSDTAFEVDLEPGDYEVTVIAGDSAEESNVGVKVESIQKVQNTTFSSSEYMERTFEIALIDGKLSVALTGNTPKINGLVIRKLSERSASENPTVYVASDSTAQTYDPYWKPQAGWGQMLDRFFTDDITVANHAIGGRSSKTFITEGRYDTILREMKPKDYLLIQFGHNDATISRPERYTTVEEYKGYLEDYVEGVRQRGAIPILVTPVNRRDYDSETGEFNVSFPEYKEGMEEVAEDLDVLLVDLNQRSRSYFNKVGPEGTKAIFLHADPGIYDAFPNGVEDNTHFQEYGAIQVARLLSEGIESLDTELASYVKNIEPPENVPAKPENIQVSNVSNAGAVLSWNDVEEADIYRVYRRKEAEEDYQLVGSSTVSQTNLSGMEEGESYNIVIKAVNAKGESEASDTVIIVTKEATYKYDFEQSGSPTKDGYTSVTTDTVYSEETGYGLLNNEGVITRDRGGDDLLRDWIGYFNTGWDFQVDLPNGLYSVKVYVGDFLGSARTDLSIEDVGYGTISAGKQSSTDKVVPEVPVKDGNMNFHFGGQTGIANGLEITPILLAPYDLEVLDKSLESDNVSATIGWAEAAGADHYNVYRKAEGAAKAEKIGTTKEASYTDDTTKPGITYEYYVTTVNALGTETVESETLSVTMVDESVEVPSAPGNLSVQDYDKREVTLAWDSVEGAISYNVYRAEKEDGEYQLIGTSDSASFTDKDVLTTVPYYYQVKAVNGGGLSEASNTMESPSDTVLSKQMEDLTRAAIAVPNEEGILVSWRYLGTDPTDLGFHVYRNGEQITEEPITDRTNYVDSEGKSGDTYQIHPVKDGELYGDRATTTALEESHLNIPLNKPAAGETPLGDPYTYSANDASVGDVDGDGEYEYIVKWDPSNSHDNSQTGYTGNVYLDAYELDGTRLWRIDLGINIRAGAHYTQFIVYDFDGDGKSEVAMKTADGTVDGQGTVIGDGSKDHRNSSGYILQGDEYLTVFDGENGAAIDTVDYEPPRGNVDSWGDGYGNRVDRFLAGVAYLDGENPSLIMARGYYTRSVVVAYDFSDGKLEKRWRFDTNDEGYSDWEGQGYHSLSTADVDGDQKQEVVYGQITIDDDGTGLYNTGLGHGDALHVGDYIPDRDGLEIFTPQEHTDAEYGYDMRDAETGEVIWGEHTGVDTGRGLVADIDPRYEGAEAWGVDEAWNSPTGGLHKATGEKISTNIPSANFAIWWDGDVQRELLDHDWDQEAEKGVGVISKWNYETEESDVLLRAEGTLSNNYTKGTPALQADIFGDWREEAIWRTEDSSALRIYFTDQETDKRIFTLMHDAQYRTAVAWQNVGYNQPPHPSFYIGEGMEIPAQPAISPVEVDKPDGNAPITSVDIQQETKNDWYVEPVTGQFRVVDESKTSTYYQINDQEQVQGNEFTISEDGKYTVSYWSEDEAGNKEEAHQVEVNLDQTAPDIALSIEDGQEFTLIDKITLACEFTDALSGVAEKNCDTGIDSNKQEVYGFELWFGKHELKASATDKVGNHSEKAVSFKVTFDWQSLKELIEMLIKQNNHDEKLIKKLTHFVDQAEAKKQPNAKRNMMDNFTKQVEKAPAEALTEEEKQTLKELAEYLKENEQ